ncbi:helix-turn-helix domain-containing protein [Mucilaginibacter sp. KACC 22063]|nr:helix-turn-helix domain-containing protein [Mucilaginibacter sp. KACC 22063]WDF57476.1 helix-turn-helix domain-containing protein [Mucilaginibacter sp. KACC 22063]
MSNRVIQEARILLKQTDWSVADVAYTLGFDDVAHFSNYFKKQTSFTPLAFRA